MQTIYIIVKILCFVLFGTISSNTQKNQSLEDEELKNRLSNFDNELVSIDSIDFSKYENLSDLRAWLIDTLTPLKWKIKYYVKNDETINQDIYIKISKKGFENIYKGEHLLEYRRYFIPTFLSETDDAIIMEHGCATDCAAITLISKNEVNDIETYVHILDFNEERNLLLYFTDSTYRHENKMLQIEFIDLEKNKKSTFSLQSICSAVYKPSCIDTIIYNKHDIEIVTSLRESLDDIEAIQKRHLIKITK